MKTVVVVAGVQYFGGTAVPGYVYAYASYFFCILLTTNHIKLIFGIFFRPVFHNEFLDRVPLIAKRNFTHFWPLCVCLNFLEHLVEVLTF